MSLTYCGGKEIKQRPFRWPLVSQCIMILSQRETMDYSYTVVCVWNDAIKSAPVIQEESSHVFLFMMPNRTSCLSRSKTSTVLFTTRSTSMSSSVKDASWSSCCRRSWRNVVLDSFSWAAKDLMCSGGTWFSTVSDKMIIIFWALAKWVKNINDACDWPLAVFIASEMSRRHAWSAWWSTLVAHFRRSASCNNMSPQDRHFLHCCSGIFNIHLKDLAVATNTQFVWCCPQLGSGGSSVQWRSTPSPAGWRETIQEEIQTEEMVQYVY